MTEETENLVLELLRRMREDLSAFRTEMREEVGDLKLRSSALEQTVAQGFSSNQVAIGQIQVSMGSFHRRADRIDTRNDSYEGRLERLADKNNAIEARLARIEERLKLTDA